MNKKKSIGCLRDEGKSQLFSWNVSCGQEIRSILKILSPCPEERLASRMTQAEKPHRRLLQEAVADPWRHIRQINFPPFRRAPSFRRIKNASRWSLKSWSSKLHSARFSFSFSSLHRWIVDSRELLNKHLAKYHTITRARITIMTTSTTHSLSRVKETRS